MDTESKNDKELIEIHQKAILADLHNSMTREVGVLRELLGNIRSEQEAILRNDTEGLQAALKVREPQIDALYDCRKKRSDLMRSLAKTEGLQAPLDGDLSSATLEVLYSDKSVEGCAILCLRDQILALLTQMQDQTERNSYLIRNKVNMTKEMIRRLCPTKDSNTYGKNGTMANKKQCAVAIINREV